MSSIPSGDINIQPITEIIFNAPYNDNHTYDVKIFNPPYDDKHTHHIKIINATGRRIEWTVKTANMKRPDACGALNPKEEALVAVSCDSFYNGREVCFIS
ncbi:hypothetical protein KIN20_035660 [Parelaphostrongylus tenuis]|uniref:MSP domain-containing protein n=1 Tax=Parelaphostrongylus tenuis TaxID=148309 RepID=A0AAD5RBS2_PARTN|nr:hypothetical protein KIN20_035660 [Parelaphostrongylus tenuis]